MKLSPVRIKLSGLIPQVKSDLEHANLYSVLEKNHFYGSTEDALRYARKLLEDEKIDDTLM